VVTPTLEADEDALRFGQLSAHERTRILVQRFDAAMSALRTDGSEDAPRRQAEDALSCLRSELFGTARGRKRHAAMEAELVAVVRLSEAGADAGMAPGGGQ
jgi:hypothetical protein